MLLAQTSGNQTSVRENFLPENEVGAGAPSFYSVAQGMLSPHSLSKKACVLI